MTIKLHVVNDLDHNKTIGNYESIVIPRVGEYLDANNGTWIVTKIQHDLIGSLFPTGCPYPRQELVVVYVVEVK